MPSLRLSLTVANVRDGKPTPPDDLARFAERAERHGFHALYLTDHYVYVGTPLHSVSAAAVLAQATDAIQIGFAAYVLPLRHPIAAAKELAMLDGLAEGRLIAGFAAGSNAQEFAAFGIPFEQRGRMLTEGLAAVRALWTQERASHHGRCWSFDDVAIEPKPLQEPHPPIWVGSWTGSPVAARRVAKYAAGWQASGLHTTVEEIGTGWDAIVRACEEIGRDRATVGRAYVNAVTHLAASREEAWAALAPGMRQREELRIVGTPDDAIAHLTRLADAGMEEVSLLLPGWSEDQLDLVAREVLPAFQ